MTRDQQMRKALELLAPSKRDLAECRAYIETVLNAMEAAARAAEHAKVTRKSMRAYSATLQRMQAVSHKHHVAGGALAIPHDQIERAAHFDKEWSAHWHPPPDTLKEQFAVALAYELLSVWNPGVISINRDGTWHELAALLYGDEQRNLYRQLRAFNEVRSRQQ